MPIFILILGFCISCSEDDKIANNVLAGEGIFTTLVGDMLIEGELFLPEGEGPFPVVIIVPGSGNSPKEDAAPFVPIINSFGYALYAYNKRGVGASTGEYPVETVDDPTPFLEARAEDVKSIISLLKEHVDVKKDEILLMGSSQGSWVNCLVYNDLPNDLSQIIMISGGAVSTGEEHYYEQLIEEHGLTIEEANVEMSNFAGDKGFDPLPILENTSLPMLFIYGGLDNSHPTKYDSSLIVSLMKSAFEIHYYPNANHELIDEGTGSFPADIFQKMETWLKSTAP